MKLYAESPARHTRQLLLDLGVLVWVLIWVRVGFWLHHLVAQLAAPGRSVERAGGGFADSPGRASNDVGAYRWWAGRCAPLWMRPA
ncbi:MAG: hypothetical protein M3Z02_10035, partial [Actinomycetota bacterium]|nr:hypothetical protein [Actinomycetota bacterium]